MSNTERSDAVDREHAKLKLNSEYGKFNRYSDRLHPKSASKVVSPKVVAGTIAGTVLTVAALAASAAINALAPEHYAALGIWYAPVSAAVVVIGGQLAAYATRDPRRI